MTEKRDDEALAAWRESPEYCMVPYNRALYLEGFETGYSKGREARDGVANLIKAVEDSTAYMSKQVDVIESLKAQLAARDKRELADALVHVERVDMCISLQAQLAASEQKRERLRAIIRRDHAMNHPGPFDACDSLACQALAEDARKEG